MHEDKTKILWNGVGRGTSDKHVEVCGNRYEILGDDAATMYLGRMLTLRSGHDTELKHRITKGLKNRNVSRRAQK